MRQCILFILAALLLFALLGWAHRSGETTSKYLDKTKVQWPSAPKQKSGMNMCYDGTCGTPGL